jgi:hypothetical protein
MHEFITRKDARDGVFLFHISRQTTRLKGSRIPQTSRNLKVKEIFVFLRDPRFRTNIDYILFKLFPVKIFTTKVLAYLPIGERTLSPGQK